jgi:hypothetical protein
VWLGLVAGVVRQQPHTTPNASVMWFIRKKKTKNKK